MQHFYCKRGLLFAYPQVMKWYPLLLLFVLLASCEHDVFFSYTIDNNTPVPLKLVCTNTNGNSRTDTFFIAPNKQLTIAENSMGIGTAGSKKEKGDRLLYFTRMDIFKNDTIPLKTDFLRTARWMYSEVSKYAAAYRLTVVPADF